MSQIVLETLFVTLTAIIDMNHCSNVQYGESILSCICEFHGNACFAYHIWYVGKSIVDNLVSIYPLIYVPIALSTHRSIYPSIYLSTHRYIYLPIDISIYPLIYLQIHRYIYKSIILSIFLSTNPSFYLSIYESIILSTNLSCYLRIYLAISYESTYLRSK